MTWIYKKLLRLFSTTPVCANISSETFFIPIRVSLPYIYLSVFVYGVALVAVFHLFWANWLIVPALLLLAFLLFTHCNTIKRLRKIHSIGFDGEFYLCLKNGEKYYADLRGEVVLTRPLLAFYLKANRGESLAWPIVVHGGCVSERDFNHLRRFFNLYYR